MLLVAVIVEMRSTKHIPKPNHLTTHTTPKIDADHSGTIDGREAAQLLRKSGLTREELKTVWGLADKNDKGELDHDEWAIAMHLSR